MMQKVYVFHSFHSFIIVFFLFFAAASKTFPSPSLLNHFWPSLLFPLYSLSTHNTHTSGVYFASSLPPPVYGPDQAIEAKKLVSQPCEFDNIEFVWVHHAN